MNRAQAIDPETRNYVAGGTQLALPVYEKPAHSVLRAEIMSALKKPMTKSALVALLKRNEKNTSRVLWALYHEGIVSRSEDLPYKWALVSKAKPLRVSRVHRCML